MKRKAFVKRVLSWVLTLVMILSIADMGLISAEASNASVYEVDSEEDEPAVTKIYFRSTGYGKLTLGEETKLEQTYNDVTEGTEVTVPTPAPFDGYQFKEWVDAESGEVVELGETLKATDKDQSYHAVFEAKQITVTFRVKDQTGATLEASGGTSKITVAQVDEWTTTASAKYTSQSNVTIKFPAVTVENGYDTSLTSSSTTYWTDDATGKRVSYSSFGIPTEDESYTLIVGAKTFREWQVDYVDAEGNVVYTSTGKNNFGEEKSAVSSYALGKLEEAGYKVSEEAKGYKLVYDAANHMAMKDGEGTVIQEVNSSAISEKMRFTITVKKLYTITASGDENVIITESATVEEGSDYTIEFKAKDGYVITDVKIDDVKLSREEILEHDGSYVFANISANHIFEVNAKKILRVEFKVDNNQGATIEKNDTYSENVDEYTVVALFTYMDGEMVKFPIVTLEADYSLVGWRNDATGEMVERDDFEPEEDVSYTLLVNKIRKNPFIDVKEGFYYYDPVLWAVENNITSGVTETTFCPDDYCTRAQVVMFLWRAAGSPEVAATKNPFTDIGAGSRFYKAIIWAYETGITKGYKDGTFRPNDPVRRGEYITFQYRAANEPEVTLTENPFNDVTKEAFPHFYDAIMWAAEHEITLGKDGSFMPNGNSTRGDVVTFLYRANNL